MSLNFAMPPEIEMIASATYMGGEKDPTAELAVYRSDFDAGEPDSRLTGESEFGHLKVRQFFPGSGCGMIIEEGKVVFTEAGLHKFVGKKVSKFSSAVSGEIIVVWQNEPKELDSSIVGSMNRTVKSRLIKVIDGLSMAFT